MRPPFGWLLILLAVALVAAPTPLGRVLLDILGGLTLAVLVLPLLLAGSALLALMVLRRSLRTCTVCGTTSLGSACCPACGAEFAADPTAAPPLSDRLFGLASKDSRRGQASPGPDRDPINVDVRDVTIDVQARSVGEPSDGAP